MMSSMTSLLGKHTFCRANKRRRDEDSSKCVDQPATKIVRRKLKSSTGSVSRRTHHHLIVGMHADVTTVISHPLVAFFAQDAVYADQDLVLSALILMCRMRKVGFRPSMELFFCAAYLNLQLRDEQFLFSQSLVWWLFGLPPKQFDLMHEHRVTGFARMKDNSPSVGAFLVS
eukprot:TRINITY_DN1627_c0_g2_i2.p1 TRINITY_DN1627_c0_g2~~TRINITY_DN1627_c0_g2_i2.p1  ORF type:complete len:172 (-),score=2.98 TRINITY_DN1627_c0_g2_i2:825-1340(-)